MNVFESSHLGRNTVVGRTVIEISSAQCPQLQGLVQEGVGFLVPKDGDTSNWYYSLNLLAPEFCI